jgi:hypothetical protein
MPANHVAVWEIDRERWRSMGPGLDRIGGEEVLLPQVRALGIDAGGRVYAGGWFNTTGETTVSNVAMWDGEVWHAMGSGIDGVVNAIAVDGNDVYFGGAFERAGGRTSWNFAR